ncbi:MAG: MOSC domain-containing protein [Alphaproteobacteria bacterium]|nr:MOSC domain-containing protein [Alphaproteobacteria bacterium]
MQVHSLHLYPIKGVRAVDMEGAHVGLRGLAQDRRWVITDADGQFLTQRECSDLARLSVTLIPDGLRLCMDDAGEVVEVKVPTNENRSTITVWNDQINAHEAHESAAMWLSSVLARPVRLFFMDEKAIRNTSDRWVPVTPVSFADGYPLLIVTSASLDALNSEIEMNGGDAVPMARFRPNIVIDGADPWAEDNWLRIRIGDVEIDLVKPCDRCVVTTKDQRTGAAMGKEPLKTLAKFRKSAHPDLSGVLFGWNAAARNEGGIKIGDRIEIVEPRTDGWPLAKR